jgi:hypothetical protein
MCVDNGEVIATLPWGLDLIEIEPRCKHCERTWIGQVTLDKAAFHVKFLDNGMTLSNYGSVEFLEEQHPGIKEHLIDSLHEAQKIALAH